MDFNWNGIFERYGLPTSILFVLTITLARVAQKVLWPFFQQIVSRANAQADSVQQILQNQLEKSEKTQASMLEKFSGNIEESNRLSKRLVEGMEELLRRNK